MKNFRIYHDSIELYEIYEKYVRDSKNRRNCKINLRINLRDRKWKALKKGNEFLYKDRIRYNTVQKSVKEVF